MESSNDKQLDLIQHRLGHTFRDRALLRRALTHSSYLQDHPEVTESNQRLEFLGDTILQMVLTEELFRCFPSEREGELSRRRSMLTRGSSLAAIARRLGLSEALLLATGEESTGGRQRASSLEDAFEALMGALYLDSDLSTARARILPLFGDISSGAPPAAPADDPYGAHENPKGLLQERVQPSFGNNALSYELQATHGEDHNRSYAMAVFLRGRRLGEGSGTSKKAAEIAAARMALAAIDRDGLPSP